MNNRPTIIGVEAERALVNELARPGKGESARHSTFELMLRMCRSSMPVDWLIDRIKSRHVWLPGARSGLFLHSFVDQLQVATQGRIDNFFGVAAASLAKRKVEDESKNSTGKKGKTAATNGKGKTATNGKGKSK